MVWEPAAGGLEDSADEVNADDAGTAARNWADADDFESAEYSIVSGIPVTLMVRDLDTGDLTEWVVSGKTVRVYTAVQKPPSVQA